ncbi:conserved unknown protein [Ectocarpus siliculosus]|uniref:N-acetyltransferase domain-containing protein n=1 Tax=Ectocarpus siliculosus TaxID=2880 RepID=D8LQA7_ECTSI|nr:conserved unknown protein [Ectocarpus siliculosus]|eukprot:CBN77487.1 conserved unknown protein [Ectocarpus siliculosus]
MLLPRCWIHVLLALLLLSFSFGRRVRNEAFLINVSSRIIGISSSRPTHATRQPNDRPPLRLPWGYDRRQQRPRPARQAAGESASVDTDVRDLKEKAPLVEIKPAKFHNLRAVSRLLVAEFYGSTIWYPAQCLVELNRLQENFHGYGEDASRHLMLLATSVEDGSLAGFVDIDGREKRPGQTGVRPYLSDLAVADRYRRMGIGTELVKACEDACIEWGYDNMYLKVREGNVAAEKLYENLGYVVYSNNSGFMVETTSDKPNDVMLCGDLRARRRREVAGAPEAE